jgi:phi13 family phage major tail protein
MGGVRVGLDSLHYAILTQDDANGVAYNGPVAVDGIISAKISAKENSATLYSDNRPSETSTALGEITVDFELKDIPLSLQAALLGHTITNGVIVRKSTDSAPYVALGFRSLKSNGKNRYIWLYKGRFGIPDDQYKTKEDKPDYQSQTMSGTFITLENNSQWKAEGDEDEAGFTAGATWFNSVYGIPVDTTAPTVTTTPADGAAAVTDNSDFVWSFDEAINSTMVTSGNFYVMVAGTGALVAGSLALSVDQKTVTFTPTAAFTAATAYIAVASSNVTDLAGNHLAANSVTNFTTA